MLFFHIRSVIDRYPFKKEKNFSHFVSVYIISKIILLLHLRGGYFTGIKISSGVAKEIEIKKSNLETNRKEIITNFYFHSRLTYCIFGLVSFFFFLLFLLLVLSFV